jgi:hypothetical protein
MTVIIRGTGFENALGGLDHINIRGSGGVDVIVVIGVAVIVVIIVIEIFGGEGGLRSFGIDRSSV